MGQRTGGGQKPRLHANKSAFAPAARRFITRCQRRGNFKYFWLVLDNYSL
jgi:hypothetical protein